MRIKQRISDFRVRELLSEDYLDSEGEHRVYRVTKRKLETERAAAFLAEAAEVDRGAVGIAGLKDRQAITIQHMSVAGGRAVRVHEKDLRIEPIGRARETLSSANSSGNAFEITVRALEGRDLSLLRKNLPKVRTAGVPNYFDDQRFGNLRHGQGWIARDLMRDDPEGALRALLAARSPHDDARHTDFKDALERDWGDWERCLAAARRFGQHHSIFEHLQREPANFAGAFFHVATRLRLIHLYAYQSHLWNRAVSERLGQLLGEEERVAISGVEGPMLCPEDAVPGLSPTFRLPGPGLEDVEDSEAHAIYTDLLARDRLTPSQFRIDGVPGFQLKGEDRALLVLPEHLRVRPAEDDALNRGLQMVRLRFSLPRGAYASLVVKRLFAGERSQASVGSESGVLVPARPPAGGGRDRDGRGYHGREERGYRGRDDRRPHGGDDRGNRGGGGGGYRGRDDRRQHGGDDRGYRGGGGGGYRGRDDRRPHGGDDRGHRGGEGGGYRGRDDRRPHGGDDRGYRGGGGGGYRGRDDRRPHGGDDRGHRGGEGGGYRGRDDRRPHGGDDRGHRGGGGGYRGRDDRRSHGGGDRGHRSGGGGYRDRDDRRPYSRDDRGGGGHRSGGGWQGGRGGDQRGRSSSSKHGSRPTERREHGPVEAAPASERPQTERERSAQQDD